MANMRQALLDLDNFHGQVIWLRPEALNEEYRTDEHLLVQAIGGSGCQKGALGSSVFVQHLDGTQTATGVGFVDRLATGDERDHFTANAKPYTGW